MTSRLCQQRAPQGEVVPCANHRLKTSPDIFGNLFPPGSLNAASQLTLSGFLWQSFSCSRDYSESTEQKRRFIHDRQVRSLDFWATELVADGCRLSSARFQPLKIQHISLTGWKHGDRNISTSSEVSYWPTFYSFFDTTSFQQVTSGSHALHLWLKSFRKRWNCGVSPLVSAAVVLYQVWTAGRSVMVINGFQQSSSVSHKTVHTVINCRMC